MMSSRSLILSFLSALSLLTVLYFTLLPQGPRLLLSYGNSDVNGSPVTILEDSKTLLEQSEAFNPEILLSAPRRSSATPNSEGDLAVYTVSTYSFESRKKTHEIRVIDLATSKSRLITADDEANSPSWLAGRELIWLKSEANVTRLIIGHADQAGQTHVAATIHASVSDLRVKQLSDGKFALLLASKAGSDGQLFDPAKEQKPRSSALLFDNLFVRHWDEYVTPLKASLWHGILEAPKPGLMTRQGEYKLGELTNLLKNTKLETPVPPFGGSDHYDLSKSGVIFISKDPSINPALNTKSDLYIVSIQSNSDGPKYSAPIRVDVAGLDGASSSPRFSADGNNIVFLKMAENGYESDQNRVVVLYGGQSSSATEVAIRDESSSMQSRSPSAISFGRDSSTLLFTAEDNGRNRLFTFKLPDRKGDLPSAFRPLTEQGHVTDFHLVGPEGNVLLLTSTDFIDNSIYSLLDTSGADGLKVVSSLSRNGSFFRISQDQVSEIWFKGAEGGRVHAWVIKPAGFDADRTYPLAYLIHGGPQGSWTEAWSTRWNPMVFAEQGYVVVLPDPTGSTGYGQDFTDGIRGQWGGTPYKDLEKGFEYIETNLDFVDTDRAVALGASYGGYMMAWIQGQPLGKKFKALVCHDGSFNIPAQLSSDEQYFPNHDMGGSIIDDEHSWDQWSPHLHISNWSTPMLVIHNELDYRLPISEGLAMFNVLQERNITSRFLTFPDENHWVLKEENSLVWHTIVINWINSFVGLPRYKDEADLGIVVQN